jgi:tRNA(Ile)-lysidine synthase
VTEVSPQAQRLRRAVVDCLTPAPSIVACSGGPDSLALVASAAWALPHLGYEAHVVIVDHGLQDGSDRVAQQAAEAARALGVDDVCIQRVRVGSSGGPEAAARDARRAALREVAGHLGIDQILLGHTRDDQAETVLMRLARGSGARSMSSMRECDPPWHRPFLDVPRDVVHEVAREYLDPLGLQAWDDPHNHDPAFTRVRVRDALRSLQSSLGPGFVPGLTRSAHLLADDADALDAWVEGVFEAVVERSSARCDAAVDALADQPRAVRTRLIRLMHAAVTTGEDHLDFDHVQHVEAMVSDWKGQGPAKLPGGVTARVEYGRLLLDRTSPGDSSAT